MNIITKIVLFACLHNLILGAEEEHGELEPVKPELLEALTTGDLYKVSMPSLQVVSAEEFGKDYRAEPVKFHVDSGLSQILNIGPPKAIAIKDALNSIAMFAAAANAANAEPVLWLELADDANDSVLRELLAHAALKGIKKIVVSVSEQRIKD